MGKGKKSHHPDPMSNARTMGREGMRLIRNIAFGTCNIYNECHVFREPAFVNATIMELDKRFIDVAVHLQAMEQVYRNSQDPTVLGVLNRDRRSFEAYNLIRRELSNILLSGGDTGYLLVLSSVLPKFKYNI